MSGEHTQELMDLTAFACDYARERGASDAAASASVSRELKVVLRDGTKEEVKAAVSRGLSIRLFVDGRYGAHATSELERGSLKSFIDRAITMTRLLQPDPHRSLADPALYEGRTQADLKLCDETFDEVSPEARLQRATLAWEAARDAAGEQALSVGSAASDGHAISVLRTTNGFVDTEARTSFNLSAQVTVRDPSGRRPDGYDYQGTRIGVSQLDPEAIGKAAAARAIERIGEREIDSTKLPLIVENRVVGRLLGGMLGPLSGSALDQRRSCWDGKLGEPIATERLTILDDPFIEQGWGSRRFNGEGITVKPRPILERGRLSTYFIDTYYGRKLNMAPTGSWSNLVFPGGEGDLADLCRRAGKAVLVTGFLGGNSNSTTGDFSHGIQGFLVEDGVPTQPLAGMNIAGNHTQLWHHLTAMAADYYPYSSVLSPSLLFEPMTIAGK